MFTTRRVAALTAAMIAGALLTIPPAAAAHADASRAIGDFDFDGYDDLVVASPLEDIGGAQDAGVVRVFYGGPDGPGSGGIQTIHQNAGNIDGNAEAGDRFGAAVAVGHLMNGAGPELVIGVPGEDDDEIGGRADSGVVHVLSGATGSELNLSATLTLKQPFAEVEAGDQWGSALAVGRVGRSGSDLAVGAPGEDINVADAGAVDVLHFEGGAFTGDIRKLHQDETLVEGVAAAGDRFGASVTMGNFNNDSFDDVAVGVPADQPGAIDPGGEVNVFYGGNPLPLSFDTDQLWRQDMLNGSREAEDDFGAVVAAGDFDGGADDLVIGVPGENGDAGVVHILYGTGAGLSTARAQGWTQNTAGMSDALEGGDRFGESVAPGDYNGDGRDDLAIGVPFESGAGAVHIIYGENDGPQSPNDPALGTDHQDFFVQASVGATPEPGDRFAFSLAAGDYNDNNKADLTIGIPGEDISGQSGADHGQLVVVFGKNPLIGFGGLDPDDHLFIQRPSTTQAGGQFAAVLH
ncbi:FG-GAP repeat protein [Thermopolyspora sp. NPDC052614]|uniref:FG-GAP repeat protein n=1 Tax=Thermopolyspora sp. NPDC052614 TaxID=3155682 RepID=UPI00343C12F7